MRIKLVDLVSALEKSDAYTGYVDVTAGRVILCGSDPDAASPEEAGSDAAQLERALSMEDDWQRYVPLPNACDMDMKEILRQFAATLEDKTQQASLLSALEGIGAVTRSERLLRHLSLDAAWQAYLHQYFQEAARDWCEENRIDYEDGQ